MQAWALGDGTAGLNAAARSFIAAHLDAAAGLPDADAALADTLDALDHALATSGRTLTDEMAWRSKCTHGWYGMVRPPGRDAATARHSGTGPKPAVLDRLLCATRQRNGLRRVRVIAS